MAVTTRTPQWRQSNNLQTIQDQQSHPIMNLYWRPFNIVKDATQMYLWWFYNCQTSIFNPNGRMPPLQNDLVVNSFKNHVIQADRLQALWYSNTEMNWLAILGSLAKVPPLFILPSGWWSLALGQQNRVGLTVQIAIKYCRRIYHNHPCWLFSSHCYHIMVTL